MSATDVEIALSTGEVLPALLVQPVGPGPRPAILVGGDITGARGPFIDMIAAMLAEAGFDSLVPEFFFREGPLEHFEPEAIMGRRAQLNDVRALSDLETAIDWLRARPTFRGPRIGTVGFCMGGTFALNLAAARDDLATVAFYGFPGPTPAPAGVQGPYPLDEVDQVRGPILAFWGDRDERVGQDNVRVYIAAMAAGQADFQAIVYPGLDHRFLSTGWEPDALGHREAMEAWGMTLDFFHANLG